MITRTPPTTNPPASGLRTLAVGIITPESTEIRAASLYAPRTDSVEHRVSRWTEEKWVAEVRVNLRMTERGIFIGDHAAADGLAWCQGLAPHAARVTR